MSDIDGSVARMNTTPEDTQRRVVDKIARHARVEVEKKNAVLQRLRVEYVAVEAIRPNRYNPNRQTERDFELLLRSMEEDGFTQPIVVLTDGEIVDGEHRWRAAKALGMTEVPVVRVEMTPEQMKIATLRHNRARGSEDAELTAQVLRDLQELGAIDWAQDSLMIGDDELNRMLNELDAPSSLAAEDYGQSWVPDMHKTGAGAEVVEVSSGLRVDSASAGAEQLQERRERLLARATTARARDEAVSSTRQVRLSLSFTLEQGAVVRGALGDRPAERLLAICGVEG